MSLRSWAVALAGSFLASPLAAAAIGSVSVDAATQQRLGIVAIALVASQHQARLTGFARVLDPGPLLQLDSDLAAAVAAADASRAEAERARALNQADAALSTKAAEAAEAQARADSAKVTLLRRRLGVEWGPTFLRVSDAGRARLIAALSSGGAALLRIDATAIPPGLQRATVDLGPAGTAEARILGPARTSDVRLQSAGLLAEVDGPKALSLPVGFAAPATLRAPTVQAGVMLPRSALYRTGGRTTVFIRKGATIFEQRSVEGGVTDAAGLFAPRGFQPGETVVVQGVTALAAAGQAPAASK
jgi:hypothetical protein